MATLTSYGFTIATEFPNYAIAEDRLTKEIRESSIITAISHIDTTDTLCQVWFKDVLSAGDIVTLDSIVAVHDGTSLPRNVVQEVQVQEEDHKTGGHFQAYSVQIDVPASTGWYEQDISWPYPVSLLTAEYIGCPLRVNDEGQVLIAPNTITGALTADSGIGDSTFSVSQTVIDNAEIGYHYGIGSDSFGRCLVIDKVNNTITCEVPATLAHAAATPSYVHQTVYMAERVVFDSSGIFVVANSKIGGSYIPANTILRFRYNNLSGVAKKFNVLLEYLY